MAARHEAERFLQGTLRDHSSDPEVIEWIGHLYDSATLIEEEAIGLTDDGELEDVPGEALRLYEMMPRLLQGVLKESVDAQQYALAQRKCRIAGTKVIAQAERDQCNDQSGPANGQFSLFS